MQVKTRAMTIAGAGTFDVPDELIQELPHKTAIAGGKRAWQSGLQTRLTEDWFNIYQGMDRDLQAGLVPIRARARDLYQNNEYAIKFLNLLTNNVVGSEGFQLEPKAEDPDGTLDVAANAAIKKAFHRWSKQGTAEVTSTMSFRELCKLAIMLVARDGECFIRKVKRKNSPFGIQLQIIEPELVDDAYTRTLENGNAIRMGVEFNKDRAPVAYWTKTSLASVEIAPQPMNVLYERIPAEEMIHLFLRGSAFQSRGVSLFAGVMLKMRMLDGYNEAVLVASRIGAAQGGFFESDKDAGAVKFEGDATTDEGSLIMDVEKGQLRQLEPGLHFVPFKPEFPQGIYPAFVKQMIRSIAAGLGVSYNSLGNDVEAASFSGLKSAKEEEHEAYKNLQAWFIDSFLAGFYSEWLAFAMLNNQITVGPATLPFAKFDKFDDCHWRGRRWDYLEPLQEANADSIAIEQGLKSRTQVNAEHGHDFVKTLQELSEEKKAAEKVGITLGPIRKTESITTSIQGTPDEQPSKALD